MPLPPKVPVLLLKDATRLVLISILIAVPVAWWLGDLWLQNFTFKIRLQPQDFIISGVIVLLTAWFTVIHLTLKTAHINPANILKQE